jgi:16S rRNA (guanine527-N7)-methyltransferase
VTSKGFVEHLQRRARHADLTIPPGVVDPLESYIRLLARWNAKINLTSLPVDDPTDETLDRLLIEPLAAARHIDDAWTPWADIGSGGGSPALPLKLAKSALQLVLIESKGRKAAFLREAVRTLELDGVTVEHGRFEEFSSRPECAASLGLVTLRAVRADPQLLASAARVLRPGGRLVVFAPRPLEASYARFHPPASFALVPPPNEAHLAVFATDVPRGTRH